MQNRFNTIFFKWVAKQKSKHAAKLLSTYNQEPEMKRIYCKQKLGPRRRIATANYTQGDLTY